jgi:uncharacterized protein RhaS with RHS repeats
VLTAVTILTILRQLHRRAATDWTNLEDFVPGTGAQQTENVWRYLHSDGLGSVRHVTGAAGQAVGQMRYTPFGETAEQSGATSLFGFTGEPQEGLSDLVYLRARYYNPALGRFLTQD